MNRTAYPTTCPGCHGHAQVGIGLLTVTGTGARWWCIACDEWQHQTFDVYTRLYLCALGALLEGEAPLTDADADEFAAELDACDDVYGALVAEVQP